MHTCPHHRMSLPLFVLLGGIALIPHARAQIKPNSLVAALGKGFVSETTQVNGAGLHYVRGGQGPALILLHGFPQDWYEFHAIMPQLAERFTVIAVDLPGIGDSTAAPGGYDAASMAENLRQLVSELKLGRVYIVGHDIGGHVAYAFARRFPPDTRGVMILDTPIPGMQGWTQIQGAPFMWHMHFMQAPGLAEKLVDGRQADYFRYFFQFGKFTSEEEAHYVRAYGSLAQLHAVFEIYRAFPENARFNQSYREPDPVPLFVGAGENSPFAGLLPGIAESLRANGWSHVETGLISGAGHYVVEDQPEAVADLIERYASRP